MRVLKQNVLQCLTLLLCMLAGTVLSGQSISGIINTYFAVQGVDFCNNRVTLPASPIGLIPGEKVLLIQMQGAEIDESNTAGYGSVSDYLTTGNYEILTIGSISFNVITFSTTMMRQYDAVNGKVQLVSYPEYTDVTVSDTLKGAPWDGGKGGIIAFGATGTVTLNADIDASGIGFRGGQVSTHVPCNAGPSGYNGYVCTAADGWGAEKGESIALTGTDDYARGAPANGGGGGNDRSTGGGGGSNYGLGGIGGLLTNPPAGACPGDYQGIGGYNLTYSGANQQIFPGGGGGSGDGTLGGSTAGGNGGGIILIRANNFDGMDYFIRANGETVVPVANDDGAGGGGGAGTVLLDIATFLSNVNVEINGGNGGDVDNSIDGVNCVGPGGGGSGGVLWMTGAALPANVSLTASGGTAGITTGEGVGSPCYNASNSAGPGTDGAFVAGLAITESAVSYVPLTLVLTPNDTTICQGSTIDLLATADGTGALIYNWNDTAGTTTPDLSITPDNGYNYTVTVTDARGCQLYATVDVEVVDTVVITAQPDTTLVLGGYAQLSTNLDDSYTYTWSPNTYISDITVPDPSVDPLETTQYCVDVTSASGCTSTDCITIYIIADVAFPNAFSPNGDGINDIFHIPENSSELCNNVELFSIYDRWGEIVYDYFKDKDAAGWDGTDGHGHAYPIGQYVYVIKLHCSDHERTYVNTLTLLR